MRLIICFLIFSVFISSCKEQSRDENFQPETGTLQHQCVKKLTDVIVRDIFAPPVASRIYAYSNLAWYEAIRFTDSSAASITERLKGFDKMPIPETSKTYNYYVAAVHAFFKTATALVFSKDSLMKYEKITLNGFEKITDKEIFNHSIRLGDSISAAILKRASSDFYKETRGMPKYSVFKEEGKWEQTPPDYADAAEPYWNKIKPLLLDSPAQFKVPPPPSYTLDKKSNYYKELMEVYNTSKTLTPEQDTIARYWDDNPFVTQHEGHLIYATKKTTPGGHWQGITSIVCRQIKTTPAVTAKAYALMSAAVLDAFIACWHEKYKSRTVRPITVIQNTIDAEWNSLLQTPPFPEYTSGHSTISAAAATVLTGLLGDNISFTDTTELEYLGLQRSFASLMQAAEEVSISRLYGGIHYRSALENGFSHGKQIGNYYLQQMK